MKNQTPENQTPLRPGNDLELRVHDGIVAAVILLGIILGIKVDPLWFWLSGATAALMFSSAFTGFCPLHFVLGKIMK